VPSATSDRRGASDVVEPANRDIERLFARYRELARRARVDAPQTPTGRFTRSSSSSHARKREAARMAARR
jgi:hypothetical protein